MDSRSNEAGERVISAAVKFLMWLADPKLSVGGGAMFGNFIFNTNSFRLMAYVHTSAVVGTGWTLKSVVAAVFKNPGLVEDYVFRGMQIRDGYSDSTMINHLVQIKKLLLWRKKQAMGDGNYLELLSEFYIEGADVFLVIADLQKVKYVYFIIIMYMYSSL